MIGIIMQERPTTQLTPISPAISLLNYLVAKGIATAPTAAGVMVVPPIAGDPNLNVADKLAQARQEERW